MIIVKTPLRISLFGGGTDYPEYFQLHGGLVVGMAIDKYVWTTIRRLPPFFDHRYRVVYSRVELAKTKEEIEHPAVRHVLMAAKGVNEGLEIHHDADLPARSGMGSSSSFVVGLINAMNATRGHMTPQDWVAQAAIKIEREIMAEAGGIQDQIWAACGGFAAIEFPRQRTGWVHRPIIMAPMREAQLTSTIALYFTGLSRNASQVSTAQANRVTVNEKYLDSLKKMAAAAEQMLAGEAPISDIGVMLTDAWKVKRELSPDVTTDEIDGLIQKGIDAGAWGGKLLGAGGGGFLMFMVPPERRSQLRAAMEGRIEINVNVDRWGSRVVLYQPDGL